MTLEPIRWYYPTAASTPVPCEWRGWDGSCWWTVTLLCVEV